MPRPIVQEITAIDKTQKAFRSINRSLGGMKTAFAGLTAALGVGSFGVAAKNALEFADAIDKASGRTGFTAEKLQELRYAASQTGVGLSQLEGGLARFTKRLGLARQGTGAAAKAYERLGVNLNQTNEQVFKQVVETLGTMENETDALALTTRLFGDDAQNLFLTFKNGNAGLDEFAEKAKELGLIISDDLIDGAVEASDSLDTMSKIVGIKLTKAFLQLAPYINDVADAFVNAVPKVTAFFEIFTDIEKKSLQGLDSELESIRKKITGLQRLRKEREADPLNAAELFLGFKGVEEIDQEIDQLFTQFVRIEKRRAELTKNLKDQDTKIELPTPTLPNIEPTTTALKKQKAAVTELSIAAKIYLDQQQRAAQIFEQTRTPLENYTKQMEELGVLFKEGFIDADTFNRAAEEFGSRLPPLVDDVNEKIKESVDIAKDFGAVFSSAFEDAIIAGNGLKDILKGLEQDLIRIITRQLVTNPLANAVTGLFSAGGGFDLSALFGGFRASGGPVMAGTPYVVGEQGPELVVPKSSGTVIPNGQLGGVVNVYVNAPAGANPEAYRQSARQGALEGSRLLQRSNGIR